MNPEPHTLRLVKMIQPLYLSTTSGQKMKVDGTVLADHEVNVTVLGKV